MKIRALSARPILDSRGEWTIEASIELRDGVRATASVPQGKSTGSSEACALPAAAAVRAIERVIAPRIIGGRLRGPSFTTQKSIDDFLVKLDGTPDKHRFGANAILAISIAFARASASARGLELWEYIRECADLESIPGAATWKKRGVTHPRLFMNMINGGVHGGSNLDIQEYVVIPKARTFAESVEVGTKIYHELKAHIERAKGKPATNLGDEGGFAPDFKDNFEPLSMLRSITKKLKLTKVVDFGMDAAATEIKRDRRDKIAEELYPKLSREKDFIYIEDPFAENDFARFSAFRKQFGDGANKKSGHKKELWIAGDDLTTTNVRRMERAHAEGSVNAVIIKPNQIGSVTESLDAVRAARRYGWAVIASHRSGETNDDFIADFAYGVGADGLKLGAPARGERVAKYNRLLQIG
jgi:enolase